MFCWKISFFIFVFTLLINICGVHSQSLNSSQDALRCEYLAIEAEKKGLEPLVETIGNINSPSYVDPDSGLYYDYNYNQIRDSVFVNLIYDTTLGFRIWKGSYF